MPSSQTESNLGIQTASANPGMMSALDAFGAPISNQEVTVQGGIGSGSSPMSGGAPDPNSLVVDPNSLSNPSTFDPNSLSAFNYGAGSNSPSFDFGTGSSSGGNLLQSAISTLTGGGGLGSIAAIGGETAAAAYGLSQAKAAQQQSQQQAQQIISATQPFLSGAQQQLSQFQSQTLTPQQQKYVDFTTQEGMDVINSGKGLQTIAQQQLGQFASGNLLPADQLLLDRNTAAAKQDIASKMAASGTPDSSIAAGYNQQIDQAAQIQKQQMLNQYFQTGNTAYNSWLTSTQQGAALMQQGAQFAQQSFQDMMQNALGLAGVGMSGLTTAIGLEIQSDTELSKSVSDLMSSLASAFAYTIGGGGGGAAGGGAAGGGAAGGGSGSGILQSLLNMGKTGNNLYNNASSLFNTSSAISSSASSAVSDLGTSLDASTAASEASTASDVANSLGFSSAGGAAATGVNAAGEASSAAALTPSALGQFSFAPGLSNVTGSLGSGLDAAASSASAATAGADTGAALGGGASADASAAAGSGIGFGQVLGAAGAGLSLYNEVNSWQSGATGQDALSGAETGAAVGTMIMPGIGTAVGAIGGAIAGGISSLFGSGKVDPENANFNSYTQAYNSASPQQKAQVAAAVKNPYVALAGYFDLRSGQLKGSNPIYQAYGRKGEGAFTNDLISKVQQAKSAGITDPNQIWSKAVQPWIASMGNWQDSNKDAMTALMQNMTSQIAGGTYQQNFKAVGGDSPWAGK